MPQAKKTQVECPICGHKAGSKSALTAHAKKEHGSTELTDLANRYGHMAPRPGGAFRPGRPLKAAPSGVPSIDWAIGIGGVPRGTIIEIFGPAGCGKTLTALTFSAYSQQHGGRCAYVDAEHRLQPTFAMLVPGLDLDLLEYSEPDGGETALNETKDYVRTGAYDIWTVDSVHGCVPKALRDKEIGAASMAELAKLMSAACQVLEPIVSETNTVVIFVNHVKSKPGVVYGRDWSKPGGSALDYYASVQLHVEPRDTFANREGRKIGHTVRVKVDNSKVAAPHAVARYNVYYTEDQIVKGGHEMDGVEVTPGIDVWSSWFSVCEGTQLLVKDTAHRWVDTATGEALGYRKDVLRILRENEGDLYQRAWDRVYGKYHSGTKAEAAA